MMGEDNRLNPPPLSDFKKIIKKMLFTAGYTGFAAAVCKFARRRCPCRPYLRRRRLHRRYIRLEEAERRNSRHLSVQG